MKFKYLKEAYFNNVKKQKAEDNLSNAEKLSLTTKKIFDRLKRDLIIPALNEPDFLYKIGNFAKSYIGCNATSTPPGVVNFNFISFDNGIVHTNVELYYTGNGTQRNFATSKSLCIRDENFKYKTADEILNEMSEFVTSTFISFYKKRQFAGIENLDPSQIKDLLSSVTRIQIDKVILYSNAPESVASENANYLVFPSQLKVSIDSEVYAIKKHTSGLLSNADLVALLSKVNSIFYFSCDNVVLVRTTPRSSTAYTWESYRTMSPYPKNL